ncbi:MAG: dephospho-CoA kinase [Actinomycetota bacterium]
MLRVGLTGGIGAGKSTVAQRLLELGAIVIDADQLAREVVAVGSTGLAAIHERFGDAVISADGSLDRGALGEVVFTDAGARRDLESITHPLIAARTRSMMESASPGVILVHDVPLLVEKGMSARYHLTVVVGADEAVRMARLTIGRGLSEPDARARVAAQATDRQRRAAADVWLDNNGTMAQLLAQVDDLWLERLVVFNDNLLTGSRSQRANTPTLVPYDYSWPSQAARLVERISMALGDPAPGATGPGVAAFAVEHIGSTSVPGLTAEDVIDIQIGVRTLAEADAVRFVKALERQGFPRVEGTTDDDPLSWTDDRLAGRKWFHGSADPARNTHVHVRQIDGPGWRYGLLFRDWLSANPDERDAYASLKRRLAPTAGTTSEYVEAKSPWIAEAMGRADVWARHTRWAAG